MEKNITMAILLDYYSPLLSGNKKDAIMLYYFEDLSLSEIAAELGISKQGARDLIVRAEAILVDAEEKLCLVSKISDIEKSLLQIKTEADLIKNSSENFVVKESAEKIYKLTEEINI